MAVKLAIRKVVALKQKAPTVFEVRVRLRDGAAATLEVSTVAFAELVERGNEFFQRGSPIRRRSAPVARSTDQSPRSSRPRQPASTARVRGPGTGDVRPGPE